MDRKSTNGSEAYTEIQRKSYNEQMIYKKNEKDNLSSLKGISKSVVKAHKKPYQRTNKHTESRTKEPVNVKVYMLVQLK